MSLAEKKLAVIFEFRDAEGHTRRREVTGQVAKALIALYEAGEHGCTALEVATWAYRMASYVYDLRHEHGLQIRMDKEEHFGGWHARYVLVTVIVIVEIHEI